jgi:hypothetical protein
MKQIAFINTASLAIEDHKPNVLSLWLDVVFNGNGVLLIEPFEALEPLFRHHGTNELKGLIGKPVWINTDTENHMSKYIGPVEGVPRR